MKSPWKYLVELASLGRGAKEAEISPGTESLRPGAASAATPAPVLVPRALTDVVGGTGAEESSAPSASGNLDNASLDIAAAPNDSSHEATKFPTIEPSVLDQPALKRTRPRQSASTKTRRRTKKTNDTNVAEVANLEYGKRSVSTQPPLTFGEEVAALDEDVKQLRLRLAEKLREQNKQLMKLLERFDPL